MRAEHVRRARRREIYAAAVERSVPRLLGMVDRGRHSRTAGSFDRDHWAWKMRDYPIGMLQMGLVPMAKLAAGEVRLQVTEHADRLREWVILGVRETLRRQHRNGAFDSVGPFTQDHGMTLAAAWVLATVGNRLGTSLPEELLSRMRKAVEGACSFGLRSDEDYAFISNHQALFALAFHEAGRFADKPAIGAHADRLVEEIIRRQSPDGWYQEYGGPDAGYETLGIHYLAELLDERECPGLLASLTRSVEFLSHCIHPDGGLGGIYGSRRTRLWLPGGLERLASRLPVAEAIAGRVAGSLHRGTVVTLDSVDHHNLPPFLGGYVSALAVIDVDRDAAAEDPTELPCDAVETTRSFEDSGLSFVGRPGYYAIIAGRTGGVGVVYDREGQRVFQDSGYLAEAGARTWTTQSLGASTERAELTPSEATLRVEGRFDRSRDKVVNPWNHLLLRILNLTLFRSVRLGAWLRSIIVRKLITGQEAGPLTLSRTIRFEDALLRFEDVVRNESREEVLVHPTDDFISLHMGSARYFTSGDLGRRGRSTSGVRIEPGGSHRFTFDVRPGDPDRRS